MGPGISGELRSSDREYNAPLRDAAPMGGGRKAQRVTAILEGLACAHCAAKIQSEVGRIKGVRWASVDFVSKRLTVEIGAEQEMEAVLNQAANVARRIEPGIKVVTEAQKTRADGKTGLPKEKAAGFILAAALFAVALTAGLPFGVSLAMYLSSYLLVGAGVVWKAAGNIVRGRVFDENLLMCIATIGAFAIGEYPEGVAVMLFYRLGEFFEQIALNRSRRSIGELMNIRPDYANLKTADGMIRVSPEEVDVGDSIVVKPGERIPLDGRVISGMSALDTSALTGESLPRDVAAGSEVLSGSININGILNIEVTKEFGQSTVSKILELVQNASEKKAPTENFITKFARYYTPAVVITAAALAFLPPLVIRGAAFADWVNRALVFLVVSCPCALVVSIPLGFFGGIGAASRKGILIKGSNYLEALNNVDTVVFDKTGTLTRGVFNVVKAVPLPGDSEEKLLEYAAYAEAYSNHPIALSILKAYGGEVDRSAIEDYTEIPGQGVRVKVQGREILAGNEKLMSAKNIPFDRVREPGTAIYLAVEGRYAGWLAIADEVKADAQKAVRELRESGVRKLVMLTGDNQSTAEAIGAQLGLDEICAGLLPGQKVEKLEMLRERSRGNVLFVGDGINDAPVLARADVGVSMGALGSDAAIEASDIVLMTDEPSKLTGAVRIAKKTRRIVWENIVFALGVKAIVLGLGAGGIATMWEAVFADVGVALIAVINAMRVMRYIKVP